MSLYLIPQSPAVGHSSTEYPSHSVDMNSVIAALLFPVAVCVAPFHLCYLEGVEWRDRRKQKKFLKSLEVKIWYGNGGRDDSDSLTTNTHSHSHSHTSLDTNSSVPHSHSSAFDSEECSICLDDYISGKSKVITLPCGHEFHSHCITKWIIYQMFYERNNGIKCPVCKSEMVKKGK